jgi:predicted metal-dependent hydrolase
MKNNIYLSDHLYNGSDNYETSFKDIFAEAARKAIAYTGTFRPSHYPRFTHRALQALRQGRLQMRERQRTWAQILLDLKCLQRKAGRHLCHYRSVGERESISQKISIVERCAKRSLRYQPRASATRRHDIENFHGHLRAHLGYRPEKCGSNNGCQYVGIASAQHNPLSIQGGF